MGEFTYAVTDANFDTEVLGGELPVLVDFWAQWCGPCLRLGPVIDKIAEEYQGKLKVAKLNVDEANATAARFSVINIPTMIMFKGGVEKGRVVGAIVPDLMDMVNEATK